MKGHKGGGKNTKGKGGKNFKGGKGLQLEQHFTKGGKNGKGGKKGGKNSGKNFKGGGVDAQPYAQQQQPQLQTQYYQPQQQQQYYPQQNQMVAVAPPLPQIPYAQHAQNFVQPQGMIIQTPTSNSQQMNPFAP